MRLAFVCALTLCLAAPAHAQPKPPNLPPDLLAPTDPLSPEDERKHFTLPEGFEAQLVASEPDIQKPMQMAWDAKGRLWVTTSYHYPFAAREKPTDKVFVLSDFDPQTGKAKQVRTFANDLNIPIGILPLPDGKSVLVSSVGEIRKYKIAETQDGPKNDGYDVLFTGFGSVDTHGMYNSFTLMPDGWVYACHGFKNDSSVKGKDGHEVKMNSGNTFRFRPDGSRIEVWTRGQVNPFGMTVDPWFNLYTADCHSKPITQLIPGAYYDSFGKPHDGLGYGPHVTAHSHNSTGLCGLAWYDADHFPKEYLGTMFLGNVVTNRINFDKIEWKGSAPVAKEQPDFLVSKDRWFRPVDIKLGPDGALYVADFYNKIIGHYEVDLKDPRRDKQRGRIWRIVWKGKDSKAAPPKLHRADFTAATAADLLDDLFHPNLTVRFLAGHQLRRRAAEGQKSPEGGAEFFARLKPNIERAGAVIAWNAFILEAGTKPPAVKDYRGVVDYAKDPKNDLKPEHLGGHLVRALASRPKWGDEERKLLLDIFKSFDSVHQHRACVEAVILHPHTDFVQPLVELLKKCEADDTHLRHAARIALRNCLRDLNKWPELDDPMLVEIAIAIPNSNSAAFLTGWLKALPPGKHQAVAEHIARYGDAKDQKRLFDWLWRPAPGYSPDAMLAAFRGVQASGKHLPSDIAQDFIRKAEAATMADIFTVSPYPDDIQEKYFLWGMRILMALPAVAEQGPDVNYKLAPSTITILKKAADQEKLKDELRLSAAEVLIYYAPAEAAALRKLLTAGEVPEAARERLLVAMASSSVRDIRREAIEALKTVPYRVALPVGLALTGARGGGEDLLEAVKQGSAPPRLLQEKAILERLGASRTQDWEKRVAELAKNLPPADSRIAGLLKTRAAGFAKAKPDKEQGAKLFVKHCSACHKIGDSGGKVAPNLDGIGVRGLERLLEDILDPNRNVDPAFRARSITMSNERTLTALMLRVDGEVLVVVDLEGKEQRLPLKEIEKNRETMLSAMPANYGDILPETDLFHLLAYLLEQKAKEPPRP